MGEGWAEAEPEQVEESSGSWDQPPTATHLHLSAAPKFVGPSGPGALRVGPAPAALIKPPGPPICVLGDVVWVSVSPNRWLIPALVRSFDPLGISAEVWPWVRPTSAPSRSRCSIRLRAPIDAPSLIPGICRLPAKSLGHLHRRPGLAPS